MDQIAKRIYDTMRAQGLSYAELSCKTGISKSALQRYATGITPKIPMDRIEKIAEALDVSPAYLMGWEDIAQYLKDEHESGRDKAKENMYRTFGAEHSTRTYHIVNDRKVALLYYHPFSNGYDASVILDVINMMEALSTEELETVRGIVRGYIHRHDEED